MLKSKQDRKESRRTKKVNGKKKIKKNWENTLIYWNLQINKEMERKYLLKIITKRESLKQFTKQHRIGSGISFSIQKHLGEGNRK